LSESLEREIRFLRAQYWSPRDPEGRAFAPLAEAYRQRGDLGEALTLVQDGLGRLPGFVAGHLVASRVARDRGDSVAARTHLDRVLELDPDNPAAHLELSELLAEDGDVEGAVAGLRAAIQLDPTDQVAATRLRELEERRVEDASLPVSGSLEPDDHLSETLPDDPPDDPLPERHEPDVAVEAASAAGDTAGEDAGAGDTLDNHLVTRTMGELYAKQGLNDLAVEVYRRLLERSPGDPELAERLEDLRRRRDPSDEEPAFAGPGADEVEPEEPDAEVHPLEADVTIGDFEGHLPTGLTPEVEESTPESEDWIASLDELASAGDEVEVEPDGADHELVGFEGIEEVEVVEEVEEVEVVEEIAEVVASDLSGREDTEPRSQSISGYFEDLLAWVPGAVPIESLAPDSPEALTSGADRSGGAGEATAGPGSADGAEAAGEADDEFDDWLRGLER